MSPNGCQQWVFPNGDWSTMIDEFILLKAPNNPTRKVPTANLFAILLERRDCHAMNSHNPAGQHHSVKLFD
jgi:hypothetical protein